jgi:hypothetical protein
MPATLADAQFITKPHKAAFVAARRSGRRLNKADHDARAKTARCAQLQAAKPALEEAK